MRNKERYPKEWNDTIRPAILKRDRYRCVKCWRKHRAKYYFHPSDGWTETNDLEKMFNDQAGYKVITIYLQVAHMNHDTTDNRPENLQSMCVKCHAFHDAPRRALLRMSSGVVPHKKE